MISTLIIVLIVASCFVLAYAAPRAADRVLGRRATPVPVRALRPPEPEPAPERCTCGSQRYPEPIEVGPAVIGGERQVIGHLCPDCLLHRDPPTWPVLPPDGVPPVNEQARTQIAAYTTQRTGLAAHIETSFSRVASEYAAVKRLTDDVNRANGNAIMLPPEPPDESTPEGPGWARGYYPQEVARGGYVWTIPGPPETLCPLVDGYATHEWDAIMSHESRVPVSEVCAKCGVKRKTLTPPTEPPRQNRQQP